VCHFFSTINTNYIALVLISHSQFYFVFDNTIFFIPVPFIPVHAIVSSFILVLFMHCG